MGALIFELAEIVPNAHMAGGCVCFQHSSSLRLVGFSQAADDEVAMKG